MTFPLLITLACLAGSALFSGFENGVLAIRRARLDHAVKQGSPTARSIAWFLRRPGLMLATILLGNNLCNSFAAIYYDEAIQRLLGDRLGQNAQVAAIVSLLATGVLTFVVLVACEITPKVWFRQQPLPRAQAAVFPVMGVYLLAYPIVRALTAFTSLLTRVVAGPDRAHGSDVALMREDFRMMLFESEEAGTLDAEGRALLDQSLDFHHRQVAALMVPRKEVVALPGHLTLTEAIRDADPHRLARFPVANEHGEWIGMFSVYDALYLVDRDEWDRRRVDQHLRPLATILVTAGINAIIPESRRHHCPMLVVVDDRGRHLGIVTAQDVIDGLFGSLD